MLSVVLRRQRFAVMILGVVPAAAAPTHFALEGSRPNVLFYLVDDWPYELWPTVAAGDRGQPNNYSALLPNVASTFSDDGLHIATLYTQPMSAPSRRSLLSGRFMTQVGKPFGSSTSLSTRITTLGEKLKEAGYATAFYGKWFLGCRARPLTTAHTSHRPISPPLRSPPRLSV